MAKEVAQLLQSWLPAQPSADIASQQRILELEAETGKDEIGQWLATTYRT